MLGSNDAALLLLPEGVAWPMLDQQACQRPVVVRLPPQIDLTSQERAYDQLYAAFASGASVVVADFTATTFCDCSSLRRLVAVQHRAAARDARLLLAIPPGGLVHRVAKLIDLDHLLPVFRSVREALAAAPVPRLNEPGLVSRAAGRTPGRADIIDLVGASHLHILRWQERLGQLRRRRTDPASRPELAATWDTVASLIDLHMRAEDEVCGPALYGTEPQGLALARQLKDAHEDVREIVRETSLQPPGSPLWWHMVTTALSTWARQFDDEEHSPLAGYRYRADPALRRQLGLAWRAFREACIRDLYPVAPAQLPTCQFREARPAVPRLAGPAFGPLACTCHACTDMLDQASRSGITRQLLLR
jgi:anti-anti-sigma regulatory factor